MSVELGQELRNILEALNTMADNVNQSTQVFGSTDEDARSEISKVTEPVRARRGQRRQRAARLSTYHDRDSHLYPG